MFKWLTFLLGLLLLTTNGVWLYFAIDLMVTEKYRQQEKYESKNQIKALKKLTSHFVKGLDKNILRKTLEEKFPDDVIFEKEGYLNSPWMSFEIGPEDTLVGMEVSPQSGTPSTY